MTLTSFRQLVLVSLCLFPVDFLQSQEREINPHHGRGNGGG
jgi:hypothetical protein